MIPFLKATAVAVVVCMTTAGCTITPTPLTQDEIETEARSRIASIALDQEPVTKPISLYDAMARALKYNLDHRTEMMRITVAQKRLQSANAQLLPQLVLNSGYSNRSNTLASYSNSLLTGATSADPTTSSKRSNLTSDLTFSWHILDFGLSYVRAQQAADRALIAEEQRRRVVNRIMEEVRTAYWRAISAQRLLKGLKSLEARVRRTQADNRRLRQSGETSPLASLTYERELVDVKRQVQRLERELTTAKYQLAALISIKPGTKFTLVTPKRSLRKLAIKGSNDHMLELAVSNRPEFRDALYQNRINLKEAKTALLEILPGAQLYAGLNVDSNSFLINQNWISWGAKIGWNIMKVVQYPARKREIQADDELISASTQAVTMAIVTQVYVARVRYKHLRQEALTAGEYYAVQRKILKQVRASIAASTGNDQALIREEMNTLIAAVEFDIAYADLQSAYASVYTSVGLDPFDGVLDLTLPVSEVSKKLRAAWRSRGDLNS